jgi:two-component SAPR family response regulator
VRASGYLLKPVGKAALAADVSYISLSKESETKLPQKRVSVKTFGAFDVYVGGRQVKFHMAKCKEILAYLVDRQGSSVTRPQLASILWEDRFYDRKLQKQLDVYIRSLRDTLTEYGIDRVFEMSGGKLRVIPEELECDVYRFFEGNPEAVNAYRGEYMSAYSWASITEGMLFWQHSTINSTEK